MDISSGVIVECLSLPLPVDAQDVLSFGEEVLGACVIDACHVNKLMLNPDRIQCSEANVYVRNGRCSGVVVVVAAAVVRSCVHLWS